MVYLTAATVTAIVVIVEIMLYKIGYYQGLSEGIAEGRKRQSIKDRLTSDDWIKRDEIRCPNCGEFEDQTLDYATLTDGEVWACESCWETYTVTTQYKVEN